MRNAVLIGGTGTGKSHLAIAIARDYIRGGARAAFTPSSWCEGTPFQKAGYLAFSRSGPICGSRRRRRAFNLSRPLNHMQIELLKRYRGDHASEAVVTGIHLTIKGIATGLRNSRKLTPLPSEAAPHGARRSRSVPR
jgi:Phosphoenolpyruvate carboxylase/IstB-like ATP binding protein